jgi:hypothetical protein
VSFDKIALKVLAFGIAYGGIAYAQELVPRAYLITPVGANAVTISSSYFTGAVLTDPTNIITDSNGKFYISALSFTRAFSFFGRSANASASLPYAVGNFRALVNGDDTRVYRSGLADTRYRFSVNLRGAPAMKPEEFVKWNGKFVLGASLTVSAPSGQYDPVRLINPGLNRWGFKPELGMERRWGKWAFDLYGGVWFFTPNHLFFPGLSNRTQDPVGAGETHLVYSFKPRLWFSFDGNFWTGGRTTVQGVANYDYQRNSRIGGTAAIPITARQSIKFSYSDGAYISIGGNYKNISAAWQYSWLDKPR